MWLLFLPTDFRFDKKATVRILQPCQFDISYLTPWPVQLVVWYKQQEKINTQHFPAMDAHVRGWSGSVGLINTTKQHPWFVYIPRLRTRRIVEIPGGKQRNTAETCEAKPGKTVETALRPPGDTVGPWRLSVVTTYLLSIDGADWSK